jgi:hypothetical protein
MNKMQKFEAMLDDGHKGAAVIVPFDPGGVWDVTPAECPSRGGAAFW